MAIVNVTPEGSNDPEYLEALSKATTPAEMVEARNAWLIAHGATTPDRSGKIDLSNFQDPADATAAPRGTISRVVKIAGRDQTFTAGSLLELEKEIGAALQAAVNERGTQPRDAATGQFTSKGEPDAAAQDQLEMDMKLGKITVQQYLNQSGELARAFDTLARERLGVDPNEVKAARFQQSWASAATEFLDSEAGSTWPGGEQNKEILGLKLAELGLTDAEDKVGALATAYAHLKAEGKLQPNPELVERQKKQFESAASHEELNALARATLGMAPRQLWGK